MHNLYCGMCVLMVREAGSTVTGTVPLAGIVSWTLGELDAATLHSGDCGRET